MNNKKVFVAGVLGNVIEFYDFTLFGFFTPLIAKLFFPSFDPRTALLLTLAIFSVSFLMRPIGGILFGHIGDRYGRKFALSLSILLMAIPTAAIGLLPAYEEIGIWASLMLLVFRLLQGISAGGEYNGAFIFLIEHGRKENAGFIGSLVVSSCALGALLAVFSGSLALHSSMPTWAWRVPFLLGGVVGLVGIYIRTRMEESPEFLQYASKRLVSAVPIIQAIKKEGISIVLTIGVATFCHVLINTMTVYINIYLNVVLNFPLGSALMLNTVALLFFTATVPFVGFISDKIGQINIMICVSALCIGVIYPIFLLFNTKILGLALMGEILLGILAASFAAVINAFMYKAFSAPTRYSGSAFSYGIGGAIGGATSIICSYLIYHTNNKMIPALYIIVFSIIGLLFSLLSKRFFCKN